MPLITIGISFYNPGKHFIYAIKSVFAQTFNDWELILIDDGSNDDSLITAQKIEDKRVKVIYDGLHLGLANRLNQISKLARGNFIARMDADDVMHPKRIAEQLKIAMQYDYDVIGTSAYTIDEKSMIRGILKPLYYIENPKILLEKAYFVHPTIFATKAWFMAHKYDDKFVRAEDRELWCSAYKDSKYFNMSEPLYFYRQEGNFSLKKYLRSKMTNIKIIIKHGKKYANYLGRTRLIIINILKMAVYILFTAINKHGKLVEARSMPIDAEEKERVTNVLNIVNYTKIPGLD